MSDLKTAFRAMRGHPAFSAIVIVTMASLRCGKVEAGSQEP